MRVVMSLALICLVGGCGAEQSAVLDASLIGPPQRDVLYTPREATSGKLHYADDRQPFAPVMTQRRPYPTQGQAAFAFERSTWRETLSQGGDRDFTIQVFACRPGALDGQTGRTMPSRGPVAACATDIVDGSGQMLSRVPLNFYYSDRAWRLHDPNPTYTPPRWATRDPSPSRSSGMLGDRY